MGFTPIEGLMMGTRSGDVDLGVVTFLMEKEMIGAASVSTLFNKHSGVLGVSGFSSDMRDIENAIAEGKNALNWRSICTNIASKIYRIVYCCPEWH